jgi:translation initiation factor 2B subunit (eIF-2B alpha/beta/delta family)
LKRGRGSQRKNKVLVITESAPLGEGEKPKGKSRKAGYIKMIAIDDLSSKTVDNQVKKILTKVRK